MYSFRLNIVADILSRVTPAGSSLGYEINRLFRFARGSILTCNKRVPHNRNDYLQSLIMMTAQWSDIKLW